MQPLLVLRDLGRFAHLAPFLSHKPAQLHRHHAAIQPRAPALVLKTACAEVPRIYINPHVMAKKCTKKLQRFYEGNNEPFLLN